MLGGVANLLFAFANLPALVNVRAFWRLDLRQGYNPFEVQRNDWGYGILYTQRPYYQTTKKHHAKMLHLGQRHTADQRRAELQQHTE
jgi:hypothetical protein